MSVQVTYQGKVYTCDKKRPLLFTMQEQGAVIPHSCQQGICQSCLCKATEGAIPKSSQIGLTDKQKVQNYFLPCVCKPSENLEIELAKRTA